MSDSECLIEAVAVGEEQELGGGHRQKELGQSREPTWRVKSPATQLHESNHICWQYQEHSQKDTDMHASLCIYTHTHTHIHTPIHTQYPPTYIHTYTHTYLATYTHTHIPA